MLHVKPCVGGLAHTPSFSQDSPSSSLHLQGLLGTGDQWGLLGRGFCQESLDSLTRELCEDRVPDTEGSRKRHLLMDEWTNAQRSPGPPHSGAGPTSCTSHSTKLTLSSPRRIIFLPHVVSRRLFALTPWAIFWLVWSYRAEDRPPQPGPSHSTKPA